METILYYLAHPYTSKTQNGERQNFLNVTRIAATLISKGINIYSPITHIHPIHILNEQSWQRWMDIDNIFMERCDAIILCPGWKASKGCVIEMEYFKSHGKPVHTLDEFTNIDHDLAMDADELHLRVDNRCDFCSLRFTDGCVDRVASYPSCFSPNPSDIAEFMHDRYEIHAIEHGWKTNNECHVSFIDMPPANKATMIATIKDVLSLLNGDRCE